MFHVAVSRWWSLVGSGVEVMPSLLTRGCLLSTWPTDGGTAQCLSFPSSPALRRARGILSMYFLLSYKKKTHPALTSKTNKHTHIWGGAQKLPIRKAGHRTSGNNWVSERSCGIAYCTVVAPTLLRSKENKSPSGSPSSFVGKEVSWHRRVPRRPCCLYTKKSALIYSDAIVSHFRDCFCDAHVLEVIRRNNWVACMSHNAIVMDMVEIESIKLRRECVFTVTWEAVTAHIKAMWRLCALTLSVLANWSRCNPFTSALDIWETQTLKEAVRCERLLSWTRCVIWLFTQGVRRRAPLRSEDLRVTSSANLAACRKPLEEMRCSQDNMAKSCVFFGTRWPAVMPFSITVQNFRSSSHQRFIFHPALCCTLQCKNCRFIFMFELHVNYKVVHKAFGNGSLYFNIRVQWIKSGPECNYPKLHIGILSNWKVCRNVFIWLICIAISISRCVKCIMCVRAVKTYNMRHIKFVLWTYLRGSSSSITICFQFM